MSDANNTPNTDPIAASLNIAPLSFDREIATLEVMGNDDSARKDFDFAREQIYSAIQTGVHAVEDLSEFARQSQNARTYEVLATLIKTVVDANKDLLQIHKEIRGIKDAEKTSNGDQNAKTINNNLFVGTSNQILELIAKHNESRD